MPSQPLQLPSDSFLFRTGLAYDYTDAYTQQLSVGKRNLTATQVGEAFFSTGPGWIKKLFSFRNKIFGFFGLTTPDSYNTSKEKPVKLQKGDRIGLFKVYEIDDQEVLLGEDDRHLDFRVSLYLSKQDSFQQVHIATAVRFHNFWGRIYFFFIGPFHRLIVPVTLRSVAKKLEEHPRNDNT